MKAKLPAIQTLDAKNLSGEKELVEALTLVTYTKGKYHEVLRARFWMGRSQRSTRVHCSLWVNHKGVHLSGYGWASGFGYHKPSAALNGAIASAGIKLDTPIDGAGREAMRTALGAIAKALRVRHFTIVEA